MRRMLLRVLSGFLVLAAASVARAEVPPPGVISGSATINQYQFFDFSRQTATPDSTGADFGFVMNEGVNFGNEGASYIPGPLLLKLPDAGSLDGISTVPQFTGTMPWVNVSYDFTYGTMGQPISVDQVWVVHTREGNYAVMRITAVADSGWGTSFSFEYKYQPDGSTNMTGGTPPPPPFQLIGTMPADGARDVPADFGDITLIFSQLLGMADVYGSIVGSQSGPVTDSSCGTNGNQVKLNFYRHTYSPGEQVTAIIGGAVSDTATVMHPVADTLTFWIASGPPPPQAFDVAWFSPSPGETGISQRWRAQVGFLGPVLPDSFDPRTVEIYGSESGPVSWTLMMQGPYVEIMPTSNSSLGEQITVTLTTGITRMDGAPLAHDTTWSFTITNAAIRPQVVYTWPDSMTSPESISRYGTINVSFDREIAEQTANDVTVSVTSSQLGPIAGLTFEWAPYASYLQINHPPFALGDSVVVTLTDGVQGIDEQALVPYTFGFRVRWFEPIRVTVADSTMRDPGSSFTLPVRVLDEVTGRGIASFQFEVNYDSYQLQLDSVSVGGMIPPAGWTVVTNVATAGRLLVDGSTALFDTTYLAGSGSLVDLHFTHVGGSEWASVQLSGHDGFFFNEGQPQVQLAEASLRFVHLGSISGTVRYYGTGAPVDSAWVYLSTYTGTDSALTDGNGQYAFPGRMQGQYGLQFASAKRGGRAQAITPMDASFILRDVVEIQNLEGMARMAGDLSGNQWVTAYDASYVLGFAVGKLTDFPVPMWLFDANNEYNFWFDGSDVVRDATAILAGDVTANWGAPPAKPAAGPARIADIIPQDGSGWTVRLEAGDPLYAALVTLTATTPLDVADVTAADGWQVAWKAEGGTLRIALAGAEPITDAHDLFTVRLNGTVVPDLERADLVLNDGAIRPSVRINLPTELALRPAAPNPFNPATRLAYDLPAQADVHLAVYNALGQTVRVLVNGTQAAGTHEITWDGRDAQGRAAASGAYVILLRAGEQTRQQRVVLAR